jgi:hypothetical protein
MRSNEPACQASVVFFNQCLILGCEAIGELPFLASCLSVMLADPTETSATELASSTHISSLLLPLASGCNPKPPKPRRRLALRSHFPIPPLPHPNCSRIGKISSSLSPLLSAPHIDLHSPSPEHTRSLWATVSDNYKKGCMATPSSSLRWLTSSCLGLKELSHSRPLSLLSQRPRPRRPRFCLLLKK